MLCTFVPGWILWPVFILGVLLALFLLYTAGALVYSIIMDNPHKDYGSSKMIESHKDIYKSKRG